MSTPCCVSSETSSPIKVGWRKFFRVKTQRLLRGSIRELLQGRWHRLLEVVSTRHQQKIDRQAFETMLGLDDELLNDMGVTRDAVRWAVQLPLNQDAAVALRRQTNNSASMGDESSTRRLCE